jgi:hypothetical protein
MKKFEANPALNGRLNSKTTASIRIFKQDMLLSYFFCNAVVSKL